MRALAQRELNRLTIQNDAEFELIGIERIEMHMMPDESREVLRVLAEKSGTKFVIWANDVEGWRASVDLAEPVMRAAVACHAYLGENAEGNAVLEFSNEIGPELFEREEM